MIEKLTPEQEALIPQVRDQWIQNGLKVGKTDKEACEKAVDLVYECGGLKPPKEKIWFRSPMEGCVEGSKIYNERVPNEKKTPSDFLHLCGYGTHDSSWLGFYDYFRQIGLEEETKSLNGLFELSKHSGWWFPFEDTVILTELPIALHRDDQNRLHSPDSMAIEYSDGWGVWSWHGIRVTEKIIKKQFTAKDITAEPNAEVRRSMIEIYGDKEYFKESNAQKISEEDGYVLWHLPVPEDETIAMLEMVNSTQEPDGTFKNYMLRVPPTIMNAKEAVAWTFDLPKEDYKPLVET